MAEDPWCVVLEFELVLGGRGDFASETVKRRLVASVKVGIGERSVHLRLISRHGKSNTCAGESAMILDIQEYDQGGLV